MKKLIIDMASKLAGVQLVPVTELQDECRRRSNLAKYTKSLSYRLESSNKAARFWHDAYNGFNAQHNKEYKELYSKMLGKDKEIERLETLIVCRENHIEELKTVDGALGVILSELNKAKSHELVTEAVNLDPRATDIPAEKYEDYDPQGRHHTVADFTLDAWGRKVEEAKTLVSNIAHWRDVMDGIKNEAGAGSVIRYGRVIKAPVTRASAAGHSNPMFRMLAAVLKRSGKYADQTKEEVLDAKGAKVWDSMTTMQKSFVNKSVALELKD